MTADQAFKNYCEGEFPSQPAPPGLREWWNRTRAPDKKCWEWSGPLKEEAPQ